MTFNNRLGAKESNWKYGRKNHFLKKSKSETKTDAAEEGAKWVLLNTVARRYGGLHSSPSKLRVCIAHAIRPLHGSPTKVFGTGAPENKYKDITLGGRYRCLSTLHFCSCGGLNNGPQRCPSMS